MSPNEKPLYQQTFNLDVHLWQGGILKEKKRILSGLLGFTNSF